MCSIACVCTSCFLCLQQNMAWQSTITSSPISGGLVDRAAACLTQGLEIEGKCCLGHVLPQPWQQPWLAGHVQVVILPNNYCNTCWLRTNYRGCFAMGMATRNVVTCQAAQLSTNHQLRKVFPWNSLKLATLWATTQHFLKTTTSQHRHSICFHIQWEVCGLFAAVPGRVPGLCNRDYHSAASKEAYYQVHAW